MNNTPAPLRLRQLADRLNTDFGFHLMLWLFGAALLVYAAVPIVNSFLPGMSIKDYELWYDTGQSVLRGEAIYPGPFRKFPFMYPPPCAAFLAPLSLLGKTGMIVALVLVNAAAWPACVLLSVRLATGKWTRQHLLLYVIPSMIVSVYAWSNTHLGQPSLLLLALLLGAFVALQGRCQSTAGALIAFAAAIKAFPVLAGIYLIYRRYWIALGSLVVTLAFFLIVLPTPFRGFHQARADLELWTQGMLLKYDENGVAQRPGRSNSWKNQSIFGLANRMLRHVDAGDQNQDRKPSYANVADLSFATLNVLIVASGLVLGLIFIGITPRIAARTSSSDALEFALLILLILLFTPLAFGYLFVWLLFPFTAAAQRLLQQPKRSLGVCALLSVALLALALPIQRPAQTYGNMFFATLVLFVGLAVELRRVKSSNQSHSLA